MHPHTTSCRWRHVPGTVAKLAQPPPPIPCIVQLVLNTEAMRFEDPRSELIGESSAESVSGEASQEREAVENAFWDACRTELSGTPPVYERTLQLIQELRDTLCSLMPTHWEGQLLLASDHAEQVLYTITAIQHYTRA